MHLGFRQTSIQSPILQLSVWEQKTNLPETHLWSEYNNGACSSGMLWALKGMPRANVYWVLTVCWASYKHHPLLGENADVCWNDCLYSKIFVKKIQNVLTKQHKRQVFINSSRLLMTYYSRCFLRSFWFSREDKHEKNCWLPYERVNVPRSRYKEYIWSRERERWWANQLPFLLPFPLAHALGKCSLSQPPL